MRISDGSSDVCSSDLPHGLGLVDVVDVEAVDLGGGAATAGAELEAVVAQVIEQSDVLRDPHRLVDLRRDVEDGRSEAPLLGDGRSEERRDGNECVSTCIYRWAPFH